MLKQIKIKFNKIVYNTNIHLYIMQSNIFETFYRLWITNKMDVYLYVNGINILKENILQI